MKGRDGGGIDSRRSRRSKRRERRRVGKAEEERVSTQLQVEEGGRERSSNIILSTDPSSPKGALPVRHSSCPPPFSLPCSSLLFSFLFFDVCINVVMASVMGKGSSFFAPLAPPPPLPAPSEEEKE